MPGPKIQIPQESTISCVPMKVIDQYNRGLTISKPDDTAVSTTDNVPTQTVYIESTECTLIIWPGATELTVSWFMKLLLLFGIPL